MKVDLTPELARICAELTGDGHIQFLKNKKVGLISFYSKNMYEIRDFISRFQEIFKLKSRIYEDNRSGNRRYKLFFFSHSVALFLVSLGVPAGNKTNHVFFVPKWIFKGSPEVKAEYLRGLYTTEGCISLTKRSARWRIDIEMYKCKKFETEGKMFMEQLSCMLSEFGVRCSPVWIGKGNDRKDGTQSVSTKFTIERPSFKNFSKYIGFYNKEKAERLAVCI